MVKQESGGDSNAVSSAGAVGVMQLMPETAKELGVTDMTDPIQNLKAGSKYMEQLLTKYNGDLALGLMAYNWGMGNVDSWLKKGANIQDIPKETKEYIQKIFTTLKV